MEVRKLVARHLEMKTSLYMEDLWIIIEEQMCIFISFLSYESPLYRRELEFSRYLVSKYLEDLGLEELELRSSCQLNILVQM